MTRLRPHHLLLLTLGPVLTILISTSSRPGQAEYGQQNAHTESAISFTRVGKHRGTIRHRVPQAKLRPFRSEIHRQKRSFDLMQSQTATLTTASLNARSDQNLNTMSTPDTKVHPASTTVTPDTTGNGHSTAPPQDSMSIITKGAESSTGSDSQVTSFSNTRNPSNTTEALKNSVIITETTSKPNKKSARSDGNSSVFGDHVEDDSTESSSCASLGCGLSKASKRSCFCDRACFVYKNCCPDIVQVCPHIEKEASEVLTQALYEAHYTCDETVGRYAVDMCPGGGTGEPQDYYDDLALSALQSATKVFDSYTGVLYTNSSIYECYKTNQSKPVYWQAVMESSDDIDFRTKEELLEFMMSAKFFYVAPDDSSNGQHCSSSVSRNFRFSVLVDMTPKQSVQVAVYFSKQQGWKTLSCDTGTSNTCTHQDCYGVTEEDGQCPLKAYVTVRVPHPPKQLSVQCIKDIAAYLTCVLQRYVDVYSVDISSFADPDLDVASDDSAVQSEQNYFKFKLIISTLATQSTIQNLLENAVAYFYVKTGLVFGEKNLQFYIDEEFGAELSRDMQEDVDTTTKVPAIVTSALSFLNSDPVPEAKSRMRRIRSSESGDSLSETENVQSHTDNETHFRNFENDRPGCSTHSSSNDQDAANGSRPLSSITTNPDCEQTLGQIVNIPTTTMTTAAAAAATPRTLTPSSSSSTTTTTPTTTSTATATMGTTKLTLQTLNEYISSSQQVRVNTCSRPAPQNAYQPTTTTTFRSARLCVRVYLQDVKRAGGICPASETQSMQRPNVSFATCLSMSELHLNISSIQKLEPLLLTMCFLMTVYISMYFRSHVNPFR